MVGLAAGERDQDAADVAEGDLSAAGFITDVLGQNFEHLPFGDDRLLIATPVSCVALPATMVYCCVRSTWFSLAPKVSFKGRPPGASAWPKGKRRGMNRRILMGSGLTGLGAVRIL